MLQPAFLRKLSQSKSVLLCGAGGGFDIFCGLPLFFALREAGIQVNLANLSFSLGRGQVTGRRIGNHVTEVTASSYGDEYYFPEGYLCHWLSRKRMDMSIYCIPPMAVGGIYEAYIDLKAHIGFDTIVLIDGGIDSVLRGDESMIGTPVEDMSSLAAVVRMEDVSRMLICLGFGAETDVCHAHALETVSHLIKSNAFLGASSLTSDMPEVKLFMEATEYVFLEMRGYESVICSSVIAALLGNYGDHHHTRRTVSSKLWINPLMMFYWGFDPELVAREVLYMEDISRAESLEEVSKIIRQFRAEISVRSESLLPVQSKEDETGFQKE